MRRGDGSIRQGGLRASEAPVPDPVRPPIPPELPASPDPPDIPITPMPEPPSEPLAGA